MGFFSDLFSDGDRRSEQSVAKRVKDLERRVARGDARAAAQLSMYRQTNDVGQLYFLDDMNR